MLLIVGRTASGKDFIANKLVEMGHSVVLSRTTRPKRSDTDDSHIFVTEDDYRNEDNIIAEGCIGGDYYYTTPSDLKDKEIYIIDADGLRNLARSGFKTDYVIVYLYADERSRLGKFIERGGTLAEFNERNRAESGQFDAFESVMHNYKRVCDEYINCSGVVVIHNDYTPECASVNTKYLNKLLLQSMYGGIKDGLE